MIYINIFDNLSIKLLVQNFTISWNIEVYEMEYRVLPTGKLEKCICFENKYRCYDVLSLYIFVGNTNVFRVIEDDSTFQPSVKMKYWHFCVASSYR